MDLSTAYGLWLLLSPLWLCSLGRFSGFLALVIHVVVGVVIRFYLLFTRASLSQEKRAQKESEKGRKRKVFSHSHSSVPFP